MRKKDRSVRYCVDLRGVNRATVKDKYPLPKISECIDALAGCDYFSCLDMANGYYQLKMDEGDRDKTAFVTKYGMFLFNRMPFGLCNAPATFSRALALVLRGLSWDCVVSFLDDLVILGRGFEDHLRNMEKVFERFQRFQLKLKPKKCELFQREVIFLGHKVSGKGVAPNPSKLEVVRGWAVPTDRKQLESFLGLANYYREYVKGFAEVAAPLHALKGGKVPFSWGEEEQAAFEELKKRLTAAPVLVYPQEGGGFILDTDASDKAIGGVLSQVQNGVERVVGYGSHVLSAAQRNYCVTRKELLAVVTFTRTYRHYLLGNRFSVRTDHGSLVWLMNFKNIEGQLARWLEELQEYDMEVLHRAGRAHGNADALSRKVDEEEFCANYVGGGGVEDLPCRGCKFCKRMQEKWGQFFNDVDYVVPLAVRGVEGEAEESAGWAGGFTKKEIAEMQDMDDGVGRVKRWMEAGGEPQREELMLASPEVKYFWGHRELLSIRQGILMYSWLGRKNNWILVAPKELRKIILQFCHSKGVGGHFGIEKTWQKTREVAIWYGQRNNCKLYVRGCAICNRQKKGGERLRGEQQLFHAGYTLERVHIDIMGPLITTQNANRYILVIVDQFTKWVEAYPMKDQQGETVAKIVVGEFIAKFGCPLEIPTDQGRNFEGVLFKEMCALLEINKTRTTSFRPSANGQVERLNYSIAQIIRCFVGEKQEKWDEYVGLAASAIRATVNRSTGFTPNMLMLGREVRCPVDLMLDLGEGGGKHGGTRFGMDLEESWRTAHILAREELNMAQHRQKDYYDLRKKMVRFKVGDVVLRKNNAGVVGGSKKLNAVWKGEWVITEVKSPVLFKVKNNKKSMVVHHDKLKMCTDEVLPRWVIRLRARIYRDMEDASSLSEGGGRSDDEQQGLIASDRAEGMGTEVEAGGGESGEEQRGIITSDKAEGTEAGGRGSVDEPQGIIASDRAKRMGTDVGVGRGGITEGVGGTTQGKVTGTVSGLPLSDATGWESGGLADIEVSGDEQVTVAYGDGSDSADSDGKGREKKTPREGRHRKPPRHLKDYLR